MKKTQILWNESKKNMLSISPYANIFVDRQGRIFCYRETLEKNIMIKLHIYHFIIINVWMMYFKWILI